MNLITGEIDTQTEVDEFGVWDKQDGWVLPVTGTVVARARWKKSLKFINMQEKSIKSIKVPFPYFSYIVQCNVRTV